MSPILDQMNERSAGNGSLMRLAPVPLFYMSSPLKAIENSALLHAPPITTPRLLMPAVYMGGLIHGALLGKSKEEILSPRYSPVPDYWDENPLQNEINEVACGSFKDKEPPQIRGRGFVVKSLEAALWAFHKSETFDEGCLLCS
jgi:ADP-ribosylglycohydrolase